MLEKIRMKQKENKYGNSVQRTRLNKKYSGVQELEVTWGRE